MLRSALLLLLTLTVSCEGARAGRTVSLPDAAPGIGFDDLRYSPTMHRLLVPAGRSGRIDLVDPDSLSVTSIAGFSSRTRYDGGHDDGPTSIDEGLDHVYVTDRSSDALLVVDPVAQTIVAQTGLGASPDYVRFVEKTRELWVTEPAAGRIEIFKLDDDLVPTQSGTIAIDNGPESIVVDGARGRVYTHRWQRTTLAIDVISRTVVAEWPNGCASSRGIALDEARGWLFSGCNEGTAAVLDVEHDGAILSTLARGAGFDVIGYAPGTRHLYLAGNSCSCLVILGVTPQGGLHFLERFNAPSSTHCATADDAHHAWVCDPASGTLLRYDDAHAELP